MNNQRFDEETLTSSLKLLAEEMESLNAPPEVEMKLRAAFRAHRVVARRSYVNYWVAGIAAALLIAISVIALSWNTKNSNEVSAGRTEPAPIKEEPRVAESPAPAPKQQEEIIAVQNPRRRSVRRAPRAEVANHVNREIATDFMPLGYLSPATLQDGGQIVRVELPRSALVNFGVPVNMDRGHEKVKADVLLGVDGLAHAIRFVQ
jgi:hypothetical protein